MFTYDSMFSNPTLLKLLEILTISITIIIVAVPEGLPLAISISMAFSVDTMKDKGGLLIKNLEACETMGVVSEICVGKTATLTKNDMTVSSFYVAGKMI
jgi:P-type E1-E2 ATPase